MSIRLAVSIGVFGVIPVLLFALAIWAAIEEDVVAVDFTYAFLPAAEDVLAGRSPYAEPMVLRYLYTPVLAWLVTPLTLVPLEVGQGLFSVLALVALAASLWLLKVRDWRVYGIVLLWTPVISGFQSANVTFFLCVLAALAWRHRDAPWLPGLWIGLSLALKPILWPLGVWLVFTGRLRSLGLATGLAALSILLVLPYQSLGAFADVLSEHTRTRELESQSLFALLSVIGVPGAVAVGVWLGVAGVGLYLARRSFAGCVICALLLAPLVWLHYFTLLVVPMAIAGAPLWVWATPVVGWLIPSETIEPSGTALMLGLVAVVGLFTMRSAVRRPRSDSS